MWREDGNLSPVFDPLTTVVPHDDDPVFTGRLFFVARFTPNCPEPRPTGSQKDTCAVRLQRLSTAISPHKNAINCHLLSLAARAFGKEDCYKCVIVILYPLLVWIVYWNPVLGLKWLLAGLYVCSSVDRAASSRSCGEKWQLLLPSHVQFASLLTLLWRKGIVFFFLSLCKWSIAQGPQHLRSWHPVVEILYWITLKPQEWIICSSEWGGNCHKKKKKAAAVRGGGVQNK